MVSQELISSQYESAKEKFPKLLQPIWVGEHWEINGAIDVIDDEDYCWDTFQVKIVIPKNFPEDLFQLLEMGKRIPKEAFWHNSIACCLSTHATIYSVLGEDLSLLNWLVKFAHPFLANFVYKCKKKEYASGEFEHETLGIIQGYEKLFRLNGTKEVFYLLKKLCSVLKKGRNEQCFCGSGIKFKYCYMKFPFTHKYSNIPYPQLEKDMDEIRRKLNLF